MKQINRSRPEYGVLPSHPNFSYNSVLASARTERAIVVGDFVARLSRWIGRALIAPFAAMRRRQRVYNELMSLDDRTLADIGIVRSDIPCLASDCANLVKAGNDNGAKAA